jgi:hypothetical protein
MGEHGHQGPGRLRHPLRQGSGGAVHGPRRARRHRKGLCRSRRHRRNPSADDGDCKDVLPQFAKTGIDIDALVTNLQDYGAKSFIKSWDELMKVISAKGDVFAKAS